MTVLTEERRSGPVDGRLLAVVCLLQVLLIALPFFVSEVAPLVVVVVALSAAALLGSVPAAVFTLCFLSAVIPTEFYETNLTLPLGFKFYEGLFLLVAGIAGLRWLLEARLSWPRRTPLDRALTLFLLLVVLSVAVGKFHGQSTSQMLRDVRYPLYYALFFVVTFYVAPSLSVATARSRTFLYVTLAASALVGVEYLFEFLSMIDVRVSGSFFRVARIEGLMLPIGILVASAALLFEPSVSRKMAAGAALAPTGLALVLTVGRGMWIALLVGLVALGVLALADPVDRRRGRRLLLVAVLPVVVFGTGYAFQQLTGAGVGDTALKRVVRVGTYEEDHSIVGRLMAYRLALEKIRERPVLGGGHGATVSYLVTATVDPFVLTTGEVDNLYLTIGLRMGIVGIVAFVWVFLAGLRWAYRLFRRSNDSGVRQFAATFFIVYSAMGVYGMADPTLFGNRLIFFHATFLGFLAALSAVAAPIEGDSDSWARSADA